MCVLNRLPLHLVQALFWAGAGSGEQNFRYLCPQVIPAGWSQGGSQTGGNSSVSPYQDSGPPPPLADK